MDMLNWGATWLTEQTGLHAQQSVTVTTDGTATVIPASLVDEAGRLIPATVGLTTEHTKFMFEAAIVASLGVTFKRNTLITWGTNMYQVVQEGNKWWTYNDVYKKQIVITAKHVPYTTS